MVFIKEKDGIFKKELNLFDLIVFGIGSTIGAGIFILIGLGAEIAGSGLIISFVIATIITLFIALNYAELGASIPTTGGSYAFVKESFGGITAFYVGWLIWLGTIVYSALSAAAFSWRFDSAAAFCAAVCPEERPRPLRLLPGLSKVE